MSSGTTKKQYTRGAALLLFMIIFVFASAAIVLTVSRGVYQDLLRQRAFQVSKEAFFAVESGIEDAIHRHRRTKNYATVESFTVAGTSVTVTRTIVGGDEFHFAVDANKLNAYRSGLLELFIGSGASFSYGLQSDTGGIVMENSSSVLGNIYANGAVVGTGGGPDGNDVFGTVVSADTTGYVEGIHAAGKVFSHHIQTTVVDGNAFCDSIDDSTVGGQLYCNTVTATSPYPADFPGPPGDQPTTSLPISDSDIEDFKAAAAAGEIIASTSPRCAGGTFVIDTSTTTGPAKIECNVRVEKGSTVWSLGGYVWIEGNLVTKNGPTLRVDPTDPSLENTAIPVVVDNEADQITSSQIELQNSAAFEGFATSSYIILISENNDELMGGSEVAINSQQSAFGDVLLYAKDGEVLIEQSAQYVGVAALLIRLQNTAQVVYEIGAISLKFPDGPGGGFYIETWEETE